MKGLVATVCASILMLGVSSQHPAYALTPQQELMKTCNKEAGTPKLTGDDSHENLQPSKMLKKAFTG